MTKSMPADMDIHIYITCIYVLKTYTCMLANANTKYMCTFTHTYCEGYMHMHAHLVFTLYVKYLQFLIFIQCTKCLMN